MKAEDIHAVLAADGWRIDGENETHPTTASSLNKTLAMRKPSTQDIRFTNNGSLFVLDKSKKYDLIRCFQKNRNYRSCRVPHPALTLLR